MCGIVGLVGANVNRGDLERAAAHLEHRGPDDAGYYVTGRAALAARRLSIIDLKTGHQPLANEDGSIWITYNGEVYNAAALRNELQATGHQFKTRTDTETVVHAYEEWGEKCVMRFRGMFAFGIWDSRRERLVLARDRFGIKPLYYAQSSGKFAFASEVRSLFAALPEFSRRAEVTALARLLRFGFIPSPLSAFSGVMKVPAAHVLIYERQCVTLQSYWAPRMPDASPRTRLTIEAQADEFVDRLRSAIDAWRVSDVPVGALLSGGVDSASLAALLAETGGPINTFTIGFLAASHDESRLAREAARAIGSHHHELTFTPEDFNRLPDVVNHLEEPQCSATSLPIYLLYRACHEAGYKVIMTGEGADELLGGYHWFDGDRRVRPLLGLPSWVRATAARLPFQASAAARRVLANGQIDDVARYWLWLQVADRPQIDRLLQSGLNTTVTNFPYSETSRVLDGQDGHPLDRFLMLESRTRMVDFINFEVDRMSMASSVEARPPFLDHELWEYCVPLAPEYKLSPNGNKLLLRIGMRARLPESILRQPKRGLAAPHADWLRRPLPAWAEEAVHPSALVSVGYFAPAEVARLFQAHRSGRTDQSRLLMGILTTQLWHHAFIAN